MKLAGKKIVIVGLGISGFWTARYLAGTGADVTVSEMSSEANLDPDMCGKIRELGITIETGGHGKGTFLARLQRKASLCYRSRQD